MSEKFRRRTFGFLFSQKRQTPTTAIVEKYLSKDGREKVIRETISKILYGNLYKVCFHWTIINKRRFNAKIRFLGRSYL
ncbi:hypothetical protein LEP1GSC068_1392 [Leptospira sp. Fiocruz LV3954]|nr:hypothetical protein LEP1GSC068_1392 [Leptospira sp. Fiocruz LV3954]